MVGLSALHSAETIPASAGLGFGVRPQSWRWMLWEMRNSRACLAVILELGFFSG